MPRRIMDGCSASQLVLAKDGMLRSYIELVVLSHKCIV
jgi:hypothetical protein